MSYIQKNSIAGRRKGCPNYPLEFKQRLVAASCEPNVSISKLALDNGINTNLLFKWHQLAARKTPTIVIARSKYSRVTPGNV